MSSQIAADFKEAFARLQVSDIPLEGDDAQTVIRKIRSTLNTLDRREHAQKVNQHANMLMDIINNAECAPSIRRSAFMLLKEFHFDRDWIDPIPEKIMQEKLIPAGIALFADPLLKLDKMWETYENFLKPMHVNERLFPVAIAVYPHIRDAMKAQKSRAKDLPPEDGVIHFLEKMMSLHHCVIEVHRQAFKDYEELALPLKHLPYYTQDSRAYETHKAEYARGLLYQANSSTSDYRGKENFPNREEAQTAIIEAIHFIYNNRTIDPENENDTPDKRATDLLKTHLRSIHSIKSESFKMQTTRVWAKLRLGSATPDEIVALIESKDTAYFDTVIPYEHCYGRDRFTYFGEDRYYAGRALYEELLERAGDNKITQLRLGIAFNHFMTDEQRKDFSNLFAAEAKENPAKIWPLLKALSREYQCTYISGTRISSNRREIIISTVNNYLDKHIDLLARRDSVDVYKFLEFLLEGHSGDLQEYHPTMPVWDKLQTRLFKIRTECNPKLKDVKRLTLTSA